MGYYGSVTGMAKRNWANVLPDRRRDKEQYVRVLTKSSSSGTDCTKSEDVEKKEEKKRKKEKNQRKEGSSFHAFLLITDINVFYFVVVCFVCFLMYQRLLIYCSLYRKRDDFVETSTSCSTIVLEKTREGHRQSNQHWNCSKRDRLGNVLETG